MNKYPKNLKMSYDNYKKLVEVLKQLAPYFELDKIQANQLYYLAYQQTCKGTQSHNIIYLTGQGLKKRHGIKKLIDTDKPIVNVSFVMELYPNSCHDSHIETATKKAVKEVLSDGLIKHKKI